MISVRRDAVAVGSPYPVPITCRSLCDALTRQTYTSKQHWGWAHEYPIKRCAARCLAEH